MKYLRQLLIVLSILSVAGPVLASEPTAGKVRILEFPKDRKVGRIFYCRAGKKNPSELKIITEASRPAIGSVSLQNDDKIALEVTWEGAEDLSWLSKLKPDDVQILDLHKMPVAKQGYKFIAKQTGLKHLFLEDTELDDEDLQSIGKLSNLIELRISKTAVKGSGLRFLCQMQKLEKLNIGHTELDEQSLVSLQCLHALKDLDLGNCGLTDRAIKPIAGITSVTILSLRSNKHLTDHKLSQLSSMKKLWNMNLADTNISNNVGKELKSLPQLHLLRLGGGKTEQLNLATIQKQLPACRVVFVDTKDEFAKRIFSPLH